MITISVSSCPTPCRGFFVSPNGKFSDIGQHRRSPALAAAISSVKRVMRPPEEAGTPPTPPAPIPSASSAEQPPHRRQPVRPPRRPLSRPLLRRCIGFSHTSPSATANQPAPVPPASTPPRTDKAPHLQLRRRTILERPGRASSTTSCRLACAETRAGGALHRRRRRLLLGRWSILRDLVDGQV